MTTDCIFCAIVYEDVDTLAFLDIYPVAEGHALVIPKRHIRTVFDLDDHTGMAVMRATRIVANALRAAGLAEGLNLLLLALAFISNLENSLWRTCSSHCWLAF